MNETLTLVVKALNSNARFPLTLDNGMKVTATYVNNLIANAIKNGEVTERANASGVTTWKVMW